MRPRGSIWQAPINLAAEDKDRRVSICTPIPSKSSLRPTIACAADGEEEERRKRLPLVPQTGAQARAVLEKSEERNKARRLLHLADPQARVGFLQQHPFFQGTSKALRERLAPQLVRRSHDQNSNRAVVLEQGAEPDGSRGMDYLFLTPPDVHTSIEVVFDGKPIVTLGGNAVFGQEVMFGVTTRFVFGTRIAKGFLSSLWVVPRSVIQSLLQRDAHREDQRLLKQRAHDTVVEIFRAWFSQPTTNLRVRLFEASEHAFKTALVDEMELQMVPAGTVICKEGQEQDWAMCVWRGEADVMHKNSTASSFARLSHQPGHSAWAAWWGLLELLGACATCPHEVQAVTDCFLWRLKQDGVRSLKKQYFLESRIFEKVALEHMRMLQPMSLKLQEVDFFKDSSLQFLQELREGMERRIYVSGEVIIEQGDAPPRKELFVVARGFVSVRLPALNRSKDSSATPSLLRRQGINDNDISLGEGEIFGEAVALEVRKVSSNAVVATTICDLFIFPGAVVHEAICRHPEEAQKFVDLVQARSCGVKYVPEDLSKIRHFDQFSQEFLDRLLPECRSVSVLKGLEVIQEDKAVDELYILCQGQVSLKSFGKDSAQNLQAPAVFGSAAVLQPTMSWLSVWAAEFCGFLAVKVSRIQELLKEFKDDHCSWEGLVYEENYEIKEGMDGRRKQKRMSLVRLSSAALSEEDPDYGLADEEDRQVREMLAKRFEGAEQGFIESVFMVLEKKVYGDDEVLLRQGDSGDFAVLIASGKCIVEVNGTRVGEVQSGAAGLIGEAVLLGKAFTRTATVRAVGEVTGFLLAQPAMRSIFRDYPDEKERMAQIMTLREQTNKALTRPKEKGQVMFQRAGKMISAVAALNRSKNSSGTSAAPKAANIRRGSQQPTVGKMFSGKFKSGDSARTDGEGRDLSIAESEGSSAITAEEAKGGRRSSALGRVGGRRASSNFAEGRRASNLRSFRRGSASAVNTESSGAPGQRISDAGSSGRSRTASIESLPEGSQGPVQQCLNFEAPETPGPVSKINENGSESDEDIKNFLKEEGEEETKPGAAEVAGLTPEILSRGVTEDDDDDDDDDEEESTSLRARQPSLIKRRTTSAFVSAASDVTEQKEKSGAERQPARPNSSLQSGWHRKWADTRSQKIREAPIRQEARMALAGRLTPLIPADRSYVCVDSSRCSTMTPNSARERTDTSSRLSHKLGEIGLGGESAARVQLRQARGLYGKAVWHESFF